MLRRAEPLAADPGLIDQPLVKSLVGKQPVAAQGGFEMAEALVSEGAIDQSDIVSQSPGAPATKYREVAGALAKRPLASLISPPS